MASPSDKVNGVCKVCGDRLSKPYARATHPTKTIVRHLTNNNCPETRGHYE